MVATGNQATSERAQFGDAPADRPPFHRGPRATLAWVSGTAAVFVLLARSYRASGSGESRRGGYDFTMNGPAWVEPVLLASVAALVVAALLLWAARRPAGAVVGLALLACAAPATLVALWARATSGTLPREELRAAEGLRSEAALRSALGAPAGHGSLTGPRGPASCLVYSEQGRDTDTLDVRRLYCFRDGRLVATEEL